MSEHLKWSDDDPHAARARELLSWLSLEQKRNAHTIMSGPEGGFEFYMTEDNFDASLLPILKKMAIAEEAGHVFYTPQTIVRGLVTAAHREGSAAEQWYNVIANIKDNTDGTNIIPVDFRRGR